MPSPMGKRRMCTVPSTVPGPPEGKGTAVPVIAHSPQSNTDLPSHNTVQPCPDPTPGPSMPLGVLGSHCHQTLFCPSAAWTTHWGSATSRGHTSHLGMGSCHCPQASVRGVVRQALAWTPAAALGLGPRKAC